MSHFTVLVIGNNVEKQLAPYDENIRVPSYDQGVVESSDILRFIDHYASKDGKKKGVKVLVNETQDDVAALYWY